MKIDMDFLPTIIELVYSGVLEEFEIMKFKKEITLACSLLLLAACGSAKETSTSVSSAAQQQETSATSEAAQTSLTSEGEAVTSEEEIKIYTVGMDLSDLEQPEYTGAPYVYVGKQYHVTVYAYAAGSNTPLESEKIEYKLTGNEGTTVIDYVKCEVGEKPNEFTITALNKALTWGHFDLHGCARLKGDKVWSGTYEYSIGAYEAPEEE